MIRLEWYCCVVPVDWRAIGLEGYGRSGNFFERQLARWTKQWNLSKVRQNPDLDRLIVWLAGNLPITEETTICHGDFRLGNLIFHPTEPCVIGVLDWELSTLGHPLADVAFNCIAYHTLPSEYGGLLGLDLVNLGIPLEQDYLNYYNKLAGRNDGVTAFHFAFALFRMAVIFEGITARARAGNAAAENAATVGNLALVFSRRALDIVDAS
jgi:aminoglycoside phosphotransferase (APT) family kinase protein